MCTQFEDGLLTEAKRRAEIEKKMQQLTSSLNETEQKLQKVSATVDQEVAGKNAALAREQALLDEIKHTATQNVAKEAEIARLREDVTAMQKNSDELLRKLAAAELQRDKVFKDKNELQVSLETLKNEKDIAEGKIVSVTKQAEVAEHSLEKMLGNAQAEIQRLLTELKNTTAAATKSKDEMDKEFRVVRNELEKSKADLSTSESKLRAAIAEQGRIRMLNHKLEESVGNEHKELVETRTKCANESTKNEALEARVKKLESDAMKNCQDLEAQKALVAQRGAENKAAKEAFERIQLELENLAKELNLSESAVKDLTLQNTRLQGTCAELEKKLTVREYAFKENVQLNNQMLTLEQEIENIDQDRKRMAETDGQHFGLLDETVKQYEALMDKYNSEILKVKNDYKEEIRDLRLQLDLVEEDKNLLLAELGRFLAMPNPCGVGMKLHESNSFKDPENGKMRRAITVGGMQPGLSADLSGVISIGDELMQVNEFLCEDMRLEDVTGRVVGNRGTQVLFRFRRYSKSGKRNGQPMEYKIVLKRGAWGPEHAVMSPEDIDMIGEGGWPEKGSLMAKDVEMDKITGGSDCSLHYEKKDEPAYGLLKTEGSALDANIKGASLSALNKMGSQGSFNRLGSTNLTEFTA
jgi:chromosome segregation ATPase